jgi:hypothetical protein
LPKEINGLLVRNLEKLVLILAGQWSPSLWGHKQLSAGTSAPSDNSQDIDILYPSPFT